MPQVDTRPSDCAASGGTWDPSAQVCRKTDIVPHTDTGDDDDPSDPDKLPDVIPPAKSNIMIPLAIAGAAALLLMSRKK